MRLRWDCFWRVSHYKRHVPVASFARMISTLPELTATALPPPSSMAPHPATPGHERRIFGPIFAPPEHGSLWGSRAAAIMGIFGSSPGGVRAFQSCQGTVPRPPRAIEPVPQPPWRPLVIFSKFFVCTPGPRPSAVAEHLGLMINHAPGSRSHGPTTHHKRSIFHLSYS